jgi:hypothetical protein
MSIRFDKLFEVVIRHSFYTSGVSEDFQVTPTCLCAAQLRRHGLLFRTTARGFTVLYEAVVDGEGSPHPRRPIGDHVTFSFRLRPRNPSLANYSDLPWENPAQQLYRLTNWNDNRRDSVLLLNDGDGGAFLSRHDVAEKTPLVFPVTSPSDKPAVKVEIHDDASRAGFGAPLLAKMVPVHKGVAQHTVDLRGHGPGRYVVFVDGVLWRRCYASDEIMGENVFGVVDMARHDRVPSAYQFTDPAHGHDVCAKTYTMKINNRKMLWRYLVVLKYRPDIEPEQLSIVRRSDGAKFDPDPGPPQQRADGTKVVPFTLHEPLPFCEKPLPGLQLKRTDGNGGTKTEIENLPNPSPRALGALGGQYCAEVFVYL